MTASLDEIAETIQKEAKDKYNSKNMMEYLKAYNPDVFKEIVDYFKEQEEQHPNLEAYEIYPMIEENLSTANPDKKEIRGTIDNLLNMDNPA
jgi:hypothetical protein